MDTAIKKGCVLAWILLCFQQCVESAGTFIACAPRTAFPGSSYDVTMDVLEGHTANVEVALHSKTYNVEVNRWEVIQVATANATVGRGEELVKLSLELPSSLRCSNCELLVKGAGEVDFESTAQVTVSQVVTEIMVQTDKAVYKPGQDVQFRVFAIQSNLRVYNESFDIYVADPNGNKIQEWRGVTGDEGVISLMVALGQETTFGTWGIHITAVATDDTTVQAFKVAEYVLPKFTLEIELATYGLTSEAVVEGYVTARYASGEPVSGLVDVFVGANRGVDMCGVMPKTVQMSMEIDGRARFEVSQLDLERVLTLSNGIHVKVEAYVTEETTGVKLNCTKSIRFYDDAFNVRFLDITPEVFKAGLPLVVFVQVSAPDGHAPSDSLEPVHVHSVATYGYFVENQERYCTPEFSGTYPLPAQNLTLPADGVLPVEIDVPENTTSVCIRVTYKGHYESKTITRTMSKTSSYLQLRVLNNRLKAGDKAKLKVSATEILYKVAYVVSARGRIVTSGVVNALGKKEVTFYLTLHTAMGPACRVLVYYTRHDNEVVADAVVFLVDGMYANKVSMEFSQETSSPDQVINMTLRATPGSKVNILAVDESVLKLKSGNDITRGRIDTSIKKYDFGHRPSSPDWAFSYSAGSSIEVFQKTGLLILTDIGMYSDYHYNHDCGPAFGAEEQVQYTHDESDFETTVGVDDKVNAPANSAPTNLFPAQETFEAVHTTEDTSAQDNIDRQMEEDFFVEVQQLHKVMSETWLWESHDVGPEGVVTVQKTTPPSATSWVGGAFATHPITGLGVAQGMARLQVVRSFFVEISCPDQVVQGEELVVKATVFNYEDATVNAKVTMKATKNFQTIYIGEMGQQTYDLEDRTYDVTVEKDKQAVVHFPILASSVGSISVEISANMSSSSAVYTSKTSILVVASGVLLSYNFPVLISNAEFDENTQKKSKISTASKSINFSNDVNFPLPPSSLMESITTSVKVTGGLMAFDKDSMLSLMTKLVGTADQSITTWAPGVFIAQYLQSSRQFDTETKTIIADVISMGYQRELTYQLRDGSFSTFGKLEARGSTWLTALVTLTLSQARDFTYVDPAVVTRAMTWLMQMQEVKDGTFRENGAPLVLSLEKQDGDIALTAITLLALMEAEDLSFRKQCSKDAVDCEAFYRWSNATTKAVHYLDDHTQNPNLGHLPMAVLSLALQQVKSSKTECAVKQLRKAATVEGSTMYWKAPTSESTVFMTGEWRPSKVKAGSGDVIATSFALLTFVGQDDLVTAAKVANWLLLQRNSDGEFVSSLATVVAIKALSAYASKLPKSEPDFKVHFSTDQGEEIDFNVTTSNARNLQTIDLKRSPAFSKITAAGYGTALAEVEYSVYMTSSLTTPSYDVSVVLLEDEMDRFSVMVCTKWLQQSASSDTVVQEIGIPSGFKPHLDSLRNIVGLKRVEEKGSLIAVYFEKITKVSLCYTLPMTRDTKVAKVKKSYIHTYDLSQPELQSVTYFQPLHAAAATVCHVCRDCCTLTFF